MAKAIAPLVLIALVVNIATAAAAVAFAQMQNQPLIPLAVEKQPPKAIAMLGNARRLPKKEPGAKEVLMAMAFAGSMGNKVRVTGNRKEVSMRSDMFGERIEIEKRT